jgi:hypothetical protein
MLPNEQNCFWINERLVNEHGEKCKFLLPAVLRLGKIYIQIAHEYDLFRLTKVFN